MKKCNSGNCGKMLKVKIFKLRLTEEFQAEDESLLNDFLESVKVVDIHASLLNSPPEKYWTVLVVYEEKEEAEAAAIDRILYDTSEPLTPDEEEVYLHLRSWREMKARAEKLPSYMILHSSHLKAIAKVKPQTVEDFYKIAGLSRRKIEKYGEEVLNILQNVTRQ